MSVTSAIDGRAASIARRRALSAGKAALAPSNNASSPAHAAASVETSAPSAPAPAYVPAPAAFGASPANAREYARARRAAMSQVGRGDVAPAPRTRAPRPTLENAAMPVANGTPGNHPSAGTNGDRVTSSRIGIGSHVTGIDDVRFGSGLLERGTTSKVGFTRTEGGLIVSGTLVRSNVPVTGDEAGASIVVTGEADQRLDDDLTERKRTAMAQYPRMTEPHGASVFSPRQSRRESIETSNAGLPVTGTAVGMSSRVTGDEALVRRSVTGNQYVAPERRVPSGANVRPDPVTGAKVLIGYTHGLQRVSGFTVEADPRVTGDDRRTGTSVTGSQYGAPPTEPAPARERGFSVRTPHHSARPGDNAPGITGSFASGENKITGNHEFVFRPRKAQSDAPAARLRVTGEGGIAGRLITGAAWGEVSNVTGTEGFTAGSRNPSERAGKPQAFSGARLFKTMAPHEDPKHLVTGMSGYSSDTGAKVTLSGGAQG